MGAVIVSMAVLLLKGKKAEYNRMYFVCQGLVVVWCVSQILILLSKTDGELKFSYQLGNIGVCFIGSAWYYFAVAYTGAEKSARWHWIPGVVSGIHYLMFLTNPWHFHYYTSFSMDEIQHGIFFYTNVAANYLFVAWGSLLLYLRLKEENKRTRQLIIASACVPLLLNAVYLTGVVKPSFDITPLGFGISGILVLFATIRYRFLEVNITAFDVILSGLEQGVAIFNPRGECTYSNESFFQSVQHLICVFFDFFYQDVHYQRNNFSLPHKYRIKTTCIEKKCIFAANSKIHYYVRNFRKSTVHYCRET